MWGGERYPNRPTLDEIMSAPVVAFWVQDVVQDGSKHTITLHSDMTDIQDYFHSLALRLSIGYPTRRLKFVFVRQREVRVKLKVGFEYIEP